MLSAQTESSVKLKSAQFSLYPPNNNIQGDGQMPLTVDNCIIRDQILALPEMAMWPEIEILFPAEGPVRKIDWLLPGIGAKAVGGRAEDTYPAMAAIACVQINIILVDDMLDEEPDGAHHTMGAGRTANLALALQAAAHLLIDRCPLPASRRAAAALALSQMSLATAAGQEMDVQNLAGEEAYWAIVQAKSTPFYGTSLQIGGILGGAPKETNQALYRIGELLGEAIQIFDDLEDAFQKPANPDWAQGRNNLVLLYGLTAGYPEKGRFLELKDKFHDPNCLAEAQEILIRCGALAYAAYQLAARHREIRSTMAQFSLPHPEELESLIFNQLRPFLTFLERLDSSMVDRFIAFTQPTP